MITGVAFCPHPPVIVPAVAVGAAGELDDLRAACRAAIRDVMAGSPDRIALLGPGPVTGEFPADAVGSLSAYGVDLRIELSPAPSRQTPPEPALPLSLTVGTWLLGCAGWQGPVTALALAADVDLETLRCHAATLAARAQRTALLVMADASSTRTEKAPGSWQPGALAFDDQVSAALASGEPDRLAGVDLATALEVGAQGWPAWRAAALATAPDRWRAHLYYDDAPYGVGYLVASWT
ncbi:MAG: hypothetical protein ABI468_02235 [Candidatus Nanopelagicales bacterium]